MVAVTVVVAVVGINDCLVYLLLDKPHDQQ